jgi:hypothetical protein
LPDTKGNFKAAQKPGNSKQQHAGQAVFISVVASLPVASEEIFTE